MKSFNNFKDTFKANGKKENRATAPAVTFSQKTEQVVKEDGAGISTMDTPTQVTGATNLDYKNRPAKQLPGQLARTKSKYVTKALAKANKYTDTSDTYEEADFGSTAGEPGVAQGMEPGFYGTPGKHRKIPDPKQVNKFKAVPSKLKTGYVSVGANSEEVKFERDTILELSKKTLRSYMMKALDSKHGSTIPFQMKAIRNNSPENAKNLEKAKRRHDWIDKADEKLQTKKEEVDMNEAKVTLKQPKYVQPGQEPIMSPDSLPNVNAATQLGSNLAGDSGIREPGVSAATRDAGGQWKFQDKDAKLLKRKMGAPGKAKPVKEAMDGSVAPEDGPHVKNLVNQMSKLHKKGASTWKSHPGYAMSATTESFAEDTDLGPGSFGMNPGQGSSVAMNKGYPLNQNDVEEFHTGSMTGNEDTEARMGDDNMHVGELVQCGRTNRIGRVINVAGDHCTVEYADKTNEAGHCSWWTKLASYNEPVFKTSRLANESFNITEANYRSRHNKERGENWNVKLKPAGHGMEGKKVRSYDFPGIHDSHYIEGHVVAETPHEYHIKTTKVVRGHKEEPISDHLTHVRAHKGLHHNWLGGRPLHGVYQLPKETNEDVDRGMPKLKTFEQMRESSLNETASSEELASHAEKAAAKLHKYAKAEKEKFIADMHHEDAKGFEKVAHHLRTDNHHLARHAFIGMDSAPQSMTPKLKKYFLHDW